MAIVRIGKWSFCRLERSRTFEILQAGSSLYEVAGMFDVAQRTLSKLMAIYREKDKTDLFVLKKTRSTSAEEKIVKSCAITWSDGYIFG